MKSEGVWSVLTVPGHILEKKLNELAREKTEVVKIERTGSNWTVITHVAEQQTPKGKVFGFSAQRE